MSKYINKFQKLISRIGMGHIWSTFKLMMMMMMMMIRRRIKSYWMIGMMVFTVTTAM